MTKPFNIRVYGLLIYNHQVLVTDEYLMDTEITKFPGGGLEFGEGTTECLIREFQEELNINVEIIKHFYTTDFFVKSAFNDTQVVSIYYTVSTKKPEQIPTVEKPHQYTDKKNGAQVFRWINLNDIKSSDFTFIIDEKVAEMLNQTKA
jgi:8-oxo-dGTP diphosphatase